MKFRMIDRIVSYRPRQSIRGVKAVSFEEYSLRDRLGIAPALPETLLTECLFQLGNWLIIVSSDFTQMGMVVRTEQLEFLEPVRPGQSIDADVRVRRYRDDGVVFDGRASVAGRVVARGSACLAVPVDLADYYDADDLRVLFSEIHRPDGD